MILCLKFLEVWSQARSDRSTSLALFRMLLALKKTQNVQIFGHVALVLFHNFTVNVTESTPMHVMAKKIKDKNTRLITSHEGDCSKYLLHCNLSLRREIKVSVMGHNDAAKQNGHDTYTKCENQKKNKPTIQQ